MNIDKLREMLGSADRIKELIANRDKLEKQQADIATKMAAIDEELVKLTGVTETPAPTRAKQKCSQCGAEGHTKRTCTAQKAA